MGKKSGPTPPDPVATAEAQGKANKDAAIATNELNMIDQYTPYGNLVYEQIPDTFDQAGYDAAMQDYHTKLGQYNSSGSTAYNPYTQSYDGGSGWFGRGSAPVAPIRSNYYTSGTESGVPRYKSTTTLSPEQQKMLDQYNEAGIKFGDIGLDQLDAVGDRLRSPLDYSSLGEAPVYDKQFRQDRYDSILDRASPYWDQDLERAETKLYNQGLNPGSEAWKRGIDDYNRAYSDFKLGADQYAGDEAARQYDIELGGRNQAINEMNAERSIPLNELISLTTGTPINSPSFVNTPRATVNAAPIGDYTYASYQGDVDNFNTKTGFNNALMGGLFGLGSAGIGAYGLSQLGGTGYGGYSVASSPFSSGNSIYMR